MIRISLSDPHVVENFKAIMTIQNSGLLSDAEIQKMYDDQVKKDMAAKEADDGQ